MAPESERAKMCESTFNWSSNYRCKLPLGHAGLHFSECDNPQFTQSWKDDGEPPTAAELNPPRTLTCSEVVERLATCASALNCFPYVEFDNAAAEKILHSWRERRVQELEAEHELFLSQLKTALGLADDGRVWFGTGLLARAETLVQREAEWREQIRKGAKHESDL